MNKRSCGNRSTEAPSLGGSAATRLEARVVPVKVLVFLLATVLVVTAAGCHPAGDGEPVKIAVEFVDHAACAYVARSEGWFEAEGLDVTAFDSYLTGMALASALGRGEVDAAYVCLIPAINVFANGDVPLKVVAGTHKYGYRLMADPERVTSVRDLESTDVRVGCPREGSVMDALLHKVIDAYELEGERVLNAVRRMPPAKILLALQTGQVDVACLPEQFATMAEDMGYRELASAQELWPGMQGSVLVVTESLLEERPEAVRKLVEVTRRGVRYVREHPRAAAEVVADALTVAEKGLFPIDMDEAAAEFDVTPDVVARSLTEEMVCTTHVDADAIQEQVGYLARLGYIERFDAGEMLDVRFLEGD